VNICGTNVTGWNGAFTVERDVKPRYRSS